MNPLPSRGFTWNIKSYFPWKTMKKYLWMSSTAVVIDALRVNYWNVNPLYFSVSLINVCCFTECPTAVSEGIIMPRTVQWIQTCQRTHLFQCGLENWDTWNDCCKYPNKRWPPTAYLASTGACLSTSTIIMWPFLEDHYERMSIFYQYIHE